MTGLFGSVVLEAAVGAASVYLLLAVFCTAVNEWIARGLDVRARNLEAALRTMFSGQRLKENADFLSEFYLHPVISGLALRNGRIGYLPPRAFAAAIVDLSTPLVQGTLSFVDLEKGICGLPEGPVKRGLLAVIQNSAGDLSKAQQKIEHWFDDCMEQASTIYRHRSQAWSVGLAILVTLGTNADTLQILHRFWTEPLLRTAAPGTFEHLAPLLGWSAQSVPQGPLAWLSRVIGWLLTVVAVSLGAPFWFDVLNRTSALRKDEKAARS